MRMVAEPYEIYHDKRGGVHALKRLDNDHFLVVIYEFENDVGFIGRPTSPTQKTKEVRIGNMLPGTILDIDVSGILDRVEKRYRLKLPRKVVTLDYGTKGDLFIRFEHVGNPVGEPSEDGLVIFFYKEDSDQLVGIEIMDITQLV